MNGTPDIIMIQERTDINGNKIIYETQVKVFFDEESPTGKNRTIHEYTISKTKAERYYKAYKQEFRLFDHDEEKNMFKKELTGRRFEVTKKEMKLILSDIDSQVKRMKPCKWNDQKIKTYYKR